MALDPGGWQRWGRKTTLILGYFLCVGFLVQGYLGGAGLMVDPKLLDVHRTFVHVLELLPIVAAVIAWTSKGPRHMGWLWLGLFLLVGFQYAFATAMDGKLFGFHALNAMLILALTLWGTDWARRTKIARPTSIP